MPLHSDTPSGLLSSFFALYYIFSFARGRCAVRFTHFSRMDQFVRKLWGMCGNPLPGSFTCFFQAAIKFYIVGYNKKRNERQLWKTCVLLLSRGSSPLGAVKCFQIKNYQFMRLGAWWGCCSFSLLLLKLTQAGRADLFAYFYGPAEDRAVLPSLALGKDCNCTSSVNGIHLCCSKQLGICEQQKAVREKKCFGDKWRRALIAQELINGGMDWLEVYLLHITP